MKTQGRRLRPSGTVERREAHAADGGCAASLPEGQCGAASRTRPACVQGPRPTLLSLPLCPARSCRPADSARSASSSQRVSRTKSWPFGFNYIIRTIILLEKEGVGLELQQFTSDTALDCPPFNLILPKLIVKTLFLSLSLSFLVRHISCYKWGREDFPCCVRLREPCGRAKACGPEPSVWLVLKGPEQRAARRPGLRTSGDCTARPS